MNAAPAMLTLYTFNLSHFSEKARWALDYEGLGYKERLLLPGPHLLVTRRLASRTHVPLLKHDRRVVQGSSDIIDYVAEHLGATRLTPTSGAALARVRTLEKRIDVAFGVGVQRLLYREMLGNRKVLTQLWTLGGPRWGRSFYALMYPLIAVQVERMYKTTQADAIRRAEQGFVELLDELDAVLTKQPYLGGDKPSRLDITAAALLAPLCRPPEHHVPWPELPERIAEFTADAHQRPTWKHALYMYKEHRSAVTAVKALESRHA